MNLTGDGDPERLDVMRVSANLFAVLGVQPERGRAFLVGEDVPGHGGKLGRIADVRPKIRLRPADDDRLGIRSGHLSHEGHAARPGQR